MERLLGHERRRNAVTDLHAAAPFGQRPDDVETAGNFRRHCRNHDLEFLGPAFRERGVALENERDLHGAWLEGV